MATETTLRSAAACSADQAAEWFARQRTGPLSQTEEAEFAQWLRADPAHTAAWASYDRLWRQLETVRDDPTILALRESARRSTERSRSRRRTWQITGLLAASVVLGLVSWWAMGYRSLMDKTSPKTSDMRSLETQVRDAQTRVGEQSVVLLPDGSKVTLNTASSIHADYSGPERRVILLGGEAFFDVAKDPARPFIVSAGSRQVVAVGTAFAVRVKDHQVQVTLVEGKVRVLRRSATSTSPTSLTQIAGVTLQPGTALIATDEGTDRLEQIDTTRATSWRIGKLVFDGERLADVVAEMNRYSREKLEISNPTLAARRVSGVFEPTDGPGFSKALEAYGIAHATRKSPTMIVLSAPE